MTAEQFYMEHQEFEDLYNPDAFLFAEAYAAAQLAEKEREMTERFKLDVQSIKNQEIKAMAKHTPLPASATERLIRRLRERLQEAQASAADWKRKFKELTPEDIRSMAWDTNALLEKELADSRERLRQREAELEQRWIAVGERLPEDGISALIFVPEWEDLYLRYRVAWINYDQSPPVWVYAGHEVREVTHWQPIPAPPKEAK